MRNPGITPPPRPRVPVPSQEQDIRLSNIHSHTPRYQEKTLSQRLEGADGLPGRRGFRVGRESGAAWDPRPWGAVGEHRQQPGES